MKYFKALAILVVLSAFASAQTYINVHHNPTNGPQPGHASVIETIDLGTGLGSASRTLNFVGTSAKFIISGQITGGSYNPSDLIFQIRVCNVQNCSGSVNATIGSVQLGTFNSDQSPNLFTVEGVLWTYVAGATATMQSDLQASLYVNAPTSQLPFGHNQGSANLDLTQGHYYFVLVVEAPKDTTIVDTPVFNLDLVRFSFY
ncbi:hypothetical protein Acid345_2428 [Candidatus Koribacter versatilis Ellin345]|uniref:Uncharacterized protein n=1 Tax=Koribacter versatilis (strain Ellin345) TaxID=204669 RepID=Q1INX1_KORVE|nr:hypothetical protein [Candidatus Koribacter versatilis]ABF41429.1 hypothetical protein Acid345_2428 [Candidatus Koribacter versatilis Ellin345]